MAAVLSIKAEETEDQSWTTMTPERGSKSWQRPQGPTLLVAAVGLGLFLLILIFGLVAHSVRVLNRGSADQVSLVNHERVIQNLTAERETLREELQQLRQNSSGLMNEVEMLHGRYNVVAESRDELKLQVQRLAEGLSRAGKFCHLGWVRFNNKCYFASESGQTKTWENSRNDCLRRRADLVIITSKEELDFITKLHSKTWIGLYDSVTEGKWKWVDGSNLIGQGFWKSGEPNGERQEDCVEITSSDGGWNDLSCTNTKPWICED